MSGLVREAFEDLFPGKQYRYFSSIEYGRLRDYNARVSIRGDKLLIRMSRNWRDVDDDIKIGLIQELLCKAFRSDRFTKKMELYKLFVKKLAMTIPKGKNHPLLDASFDRVNDMYFAGVMEKPNLRFGRRSLRTVGSYNFHNDTITVSKVMEDADTDLLDYVMYHELLHKKMKFDHRKRRMLHHTRAFKEKEKEFGDPDIERKLDRFLRRQRFPLF